MNARAWCAITLLCGACTPGPKSADNAAPPAVNGPEEVVSCARVENKRGAAACVDPLTPEQASHRTLVFAVASRGEKVVRVERRTGNGEPKESVTGAFAMDFRYADGVVVERVARRLDGTVAQRTLYTERALRRAIVDAEGKPWLRGTTGHIATYELDASGWDAVERLWDERGAARADATGVFAWRFEHDAAGHVVAESAFDDHDRPMATTDGWHARRRTFGDAGCELSEQYVGLDGKPTAPSKGVARYDYACDAWGNRREVRYRGADGLPVAAEGEGWGRRWSYDVHGKIESQSMIDASGAPMSPKN